MYKNIFFVLGTYLFKPCKSFEGSVFFFHPFKIVNVKIGTSDRRHLLGFCLFKVQLQRIATADIDMVKQDVLPYLRDESELDIWSNDYFLQLADMIVFQE